MANTYTKPTAISQDTTPKLSGSLDVNQQSIVSTSNQDITLAPHGTGKVAVSAADVDVDGELIADKLSWGSALGLWGVPHFEVVEFNDALWKSDLRYAPDVPNSLSLDTTWVATPLDGSDNPHGSYSATTYDLPMSPFDGDFDTYFELKASDPNVGDAGYTGGHNTKNELVIDFTGRTNNGAGTTSGFVYPQGAVYLTFYYKDMYYDGTPTLETYRGTTWTTLAAPTEVSRNTDYSTLKWEVPSSNYVKKLRLTILAKPLVLAKADRTSGWDETKRVGIASMNYYMDRFFTSDVEPPYFSKYIRRNSIYSQVVLESGSADDASIGFRSSLSSTTSKNDHGIGKVQAGLYYDDTSNAMVLTGGGAAALAVSNSQKVGINTVTPATELHLDGSLTLQSQASTPTDPASGQSVLWVDSSGDVKIKINVGGTVKTATLADFSSL